MDYRPLAVFVAFLACCALAAGAVRLWQRRRSAMRSAAAAARRAKLDRAWAARNDASTNIAH